MRQSRTVLTVFHVLALSVSVLMGVSLLGNGSSVFAISWSSELQVNQDDSYSDWSPEIAVDSTGTPYIVWMGVDPLQDDEEIYVSKWEGGIWGCTERLHPDNTVNDRFPEIAAGKLDGIPWVVWARWNVVVGEYDFLVSRLTPAGWAEPETVFTAGSRYDAYDIVARDTSLVWVVWSTRSGGGSSDRDIFARKREDGVWGSIEQIIKPDTEDDLPRIDLDSTGRLWVLWDGSFQVFSIMRSDTGWTQPVFVKGDVGGSFVPFIAVDDTDVPWIVWKAGNAYGGTDIMSARWETDQWVELGMVNRPDDPEDEDKNPVIVNVSGSGPLVVWWGGLPAMATYMDIYESKWTASGWREEGHVSTPDSVYLALDESPSVAVAPTGRVWVCWMRMENLPPYDTDIWARYTDNVTAIRGVTDFGADSDGFGVHLTWYTADQGWFELYKTEVLWQGQEAIATQSGPDNRASRLAKCAAQVPEGSECLTDVPIMGRGELTFYDGGVIPGRTYLYWLAQVRSDDCKLYGPARVEMPLETGHVSYVGVRAFPNPFCSRSLLLSPKGDVAEIFDSRGGFVTRLSAVREVEIDGGLSSCSFLWDGKDESGKDVASGVYVVRVFSERSSLRKEVVGKVVLLR